jgi:hypothetical protein
MSTLPHQDASQLAGTIVGELDALPVKNTPSARAVRRNYTRLLRAWEGAHALAVAEALAAHPRWRWVGYELLLDHPGAFSLLDAGRIEALGRGMADWGTVDCFGRTISGPAWLHGLLSDADIARWAASEDRWWRRAALVSTVALNTRSQGGPGDAPRTLAVCRMLAADRDDMVVKAMSWALRKLAEREPDAVRAFLAEQADALAARARREVNHKLATGLKNPRRNLSGVS